MATQMTTKTITIGVAGTNGKKEYRDVQLVPGTKVRDVLDQLGLQGFALQRPGEGLFQRNDNLFDAVADGQKLYAVKDDVEAGFYLI